MVQSVHLLDYGPDGPGFEFQKGQETCDICDCFGFLVKNLFTNNVNN